MELVIGKNGVELVHPEGNWDLKRGTGYSPGQTLVAAVGACGTYVFSGMLEASGIPHRVINVKLEYENDESTRVKPIRKIMVDYFMSIEEEYRQRAERILELVPKNCPIMQSIDPKIEVVERVHYQ